MPGEGSLAAAYRATRYLVEADGGTLEARIGEPAPAIEALLARLGHAAGTFISAANPRSERRSERENEAANRRLEARLRDLRLAPLPHAGVGEGDWSERGYFVPGLGLPESVTLAEAFGQYAIVEVRPGAPVALHWTGFAPPAGEGLRRWQP